MRNISIAFLLAALLALTACRSGKKPPTPISTSGDRPAAASSKPQPPLAEEVPQPVPLTESLQSSEERAFENPRLSEMPTATEPAVVINEFAFPTVEKKPEEFQCMLGICVGMKLEDVQKAIEDGALTLEGKKDCKPSKLRKVPLKKEFSHIGFYLYNDKCGGYVNNADFEFDEDTLMAFEIFYGARKMKTVKTEEFTARLNEKLGKPATQIWHTKNIIGYCEWTKDNYKVVLQIIQSRPFSYKVTDSKALEAAYKKRDGGASGDDKEKVKTLIP